MGWRIFIWIRLPRVAMGLLAGGALAAAQGPAAGIWLAGAAFTASFLVATLSDLARLRRLPAGVAA